MVGISAGKKKEKRAPRRLKASASAAPRLINQVDNATHPSGVHGPVK